MSEVKLRAEPYRDDEDRLVLPLEDGSNVVCEGEYPVGIKWPGLDFSDSEMATISLDRYEYGGEA